MPSSEKNIWIKSPFVATFSIYTSILFFAFFVALYLIPDYDFWVHLAQGLHMIDTGSIAKTDVFSFTYFGKPWVNWEWLHDVVMALIWRAGGPTTIILFRVFLVFLLGVVLFHLFRRFSKESPISFPLIFVVLLLVQQRMNDRPQLFAYVAIAATVYLSTTIRHLRSWNAVVLFILLLILRNSHPSWLLAAVLSLCIFFDSFLRKESAFSRREMLVAVIAIIVLQFSTPYWNDMGHYFSLQFSSHALGEWKSLFSLGELLATPYYLLFFLFTIGVVFSLFFTYKRYPAYSLLVLLLLCNAYLHVRFIADAAIVGSVSILTMFSDKEIGVRCASSKKLLAYLTIFCAVLFFSQFEMKQLMLQRGIGIDAERVPLYVGEFVREKRLNGNMFGLYGGTTDFLMSYAYPQVKVAIDIRVPILYPYDFAKRYWNITDEQQFREYVLSLPLDYIILGRPTFLSYQQHEYYVEQILEKEGWPLVYFDRHYAVYRYPKLRDGVESFHLLSRWRTDLNEVTHAVETGRFDDVMHDLRLLKENTIGRDDYYREVILTLYALPSLSDIQKGMLEKLYDVPVID